jgi:hypothetical protein
VLGALNPLSPWRLANRLPFHSSLWVRRDLALRERAQAAWLTLRRRRNRHDAVRAANCTGVALGEPLAERIGHLVTPHYGVFIVARIPRDKR